MSLQLLAKQMEAKGRKGDSVLVHMTPSEVAALQKLAESAGGSLSVNPETGLVEASFLRRMLPTLVGIGVGIGTGNPMLGAAAGAAVGGYQAKKDDQDVGMGALMGGLGGYGGAGLGAGLTAAGGTTAANLAADAAAKTAAEEAAKQKIAEEAVKQQLAEQTAAQAAKQAGASSAITGVGVNPFTTTSGTTLGMSEASLAAPPQQMLTSVAQPSIVNPAAAQLPNAATAAATPTAPTAFQPDLTASESLSRAGEGIGQLAKKEGRTAFGKEFGMMQAGAGMAPMMAPGKLQQPEEIESDDEMIVYDYEPGRTGAERDAGGSSAERQYFGDNRFTNRRRINAADYLNAKGGLLSLAEGGSTGASADAMGYLTGDSGASQAGLSYLMGETSASPVLQNARATEQRSTAARMSQPAAASDKEFIFNPATGTFAKNPDYVDPAEAERIRNSLTGVFTRAFGGGNAEGGIISLAKGGMASGGFVVPADVVSALGNGSTDAGLRSLKALLGKAAPIKGKGDGLSDSIPTSIDGKQPARVADGEAYIDPKTVKRLGGAKKLYAMMDKVRAQAHGKTTQQRKVNPARVMA